MGEISVKTFKKFILLLTMYLTFVGCGNGVIPNNPETSPSAVAEDKLYIPENYKTQLESLKLTEVISLPYFHEPFICIAKDASGQQFAIVFHSLESEKMVKLPISYEKIINVIESNGFKVEINTSSSFQNIRMFEINKKLFWNYSDGTGKIFLNLNGEVVTNPWEVGLN